MKRMAGEWFKELEVTPKDIEIWHALEGKFSGGFELGSLLGCREPKISVSVYFR